MSADIKLKQVQLQLLQENEFLVPDEECNVIIPYVPSGYEDYSNLGFVKGQYKIDNFLTYKRLYTGNDAFIITWKGSTSIAPALNDKGQIHINWNLGEYILGYNEGHSSDVGFENDASFSEYKKHSVSNTLTFRIRADKYDLDENYKYLFYKVPEISKDILYRVVSLETEYIGRVKVCYVLTLQSLQQDLENTGRAKSQNVMSNAPGQGYYDPIVLYEEPQNKVLPFVKIDKERILSVDESKFINNPVKKIVVKMFGLGILMNFTMVGRKIYKNDAMSVYGIPRLVFPMNFKQATTPTLYRTQSAVDNFYFVWGLNPVIQFNKDIFNAIKDMTDVNKTWTQQGIFTLPGQPTIEDGVANTGLQCMITNPKESDGTFKYTLYGYVTPSTETPYPIHNPWEFTINEDIVGDNKGVFGSAIQYVIKKDKTRNIHDYLWDSYWLNKKISVLPLDKKSTLTFGSALGTGFFGLLSGKTAGIIAGSILFSIGLLGTILTDVPKRNLTNTLCGIFPASMLDFMTAEASVSLPKAVTQTAWFKMSYFLNDDEQDFLTFFNTQTMNTSFEATLTDLFEKDGKTYETTLIGQTKHEDGSKIFNDGSQLLIGGGEQLKEIADNDEGFIIDSFNLQSIFSGDFSVEFLDKDREVIWSGVYQSEAKWTGSIREINTWRNTSIYGRENIFLEEPKPWPEQIELAPWSSGVSTITKEINVIENHTYNDNAKKPLKELLSGFAIVENKWPHNPIENETKLNDNKTIIDASPTFTMRKTIQHKNLQNILLVRSSKQIQEQDFWKYYNNIVINCEIDGKQLSFEILNKGVNQEKSTTSQSIEMNAFIGWVKNNDIQQQVTGKSPEFSDNYQYVWYSRREPGPDLGGGLIKQNYYVEQSPSLKITKTTKINTNTTIEFPATGNAYLNINVVLDYVFSANLQEYINNKMELPSGVRTQIDRVECKTMLNVDNLCFGERIEYCEKILLSYETAWSTIRRQKTQSPMSIKIISVTLNKK